MLAKLMSLPSFFPRKAKPPRSGEEELLAQQQEALPLHPTKRQRNQYMAQSAVTTNPSPAVLATPICAPQMLNQQMLYPRMLGPQILAPKTPVLFLPMVFVPMCGFSTDSKTQQSDANV
mmetsp:Transcript_9604/g.18636  ORF Transcript_9604/g.18636 Transcript_9604/m.18636 type:complete len:119 (-) Transcript_9604:261-617(-)